MKKKIIIVLGIVLLVVIVCATLVFFDRSGMIIQAFKEYDLEVSEISIEDTRLTYYLSEEQLEAAADYRIVHFYSPGIPGNTAFMIICPDSLKAMDLLKMSNDGLYEEMKEEKTDG